MLFNSHVFLFVFLPITWILFRVLAQFKLAQSAIGLLVFASLFFYSYWNPPFVFLIIFSVLFNFIMGKWVARISSRVLFVSGIAINLGLIAYFKYTHFFLDTLTAVSGTTFAVSEIFLPLGISFFTFQQVAYLVDCYREKSAEHTFLQYSLFVTFFPQLIAGPIVHHKDVIPQFQDRSIFHISSEQLSMGLVLLSMGLFKKIIFADTMSPWVHTAFDRVENPTLFISWLGVLAYTFQIYFDFSGYSDMALGLGHLFNIRLPLNFDSPYKATSIIDFWKRWHITLSKFLRDYLYLNRRFWGFADEKKFGRTA